MPTMTAMAPVAGMPPMGMGGMPGMPPMGGGGAEGPPPPGKAAGSVKQFNMEKGFGFIMPEDGSADIFIHAAHILDGNALVAGARVHFRASFDHQKGKPIAEDVTGGYMDPRRPPPGAASKSAGPMGMLAAVPQAYAAMGGAAMGGAAGKGGAEGPAPAGKISGTVKTFNMEKGFGFIAPDDGSPDCFAHAAQLTDGNALATGARVHYRPSFDYQKQKPVAEEVVGGYNDPRRPQAKGSVFTTPDMLAPPNMYGAMGGYGGQANPYGGQANPYGGMGLDAQQQQLALQQQQLLLQQQLAYQQF